MGNNAMLGWEGHVRVGKRGGGGIWERKMGRRAESTVTAVTRTLTIYKKREQRREGHARKEKRGKEEEDEEDEDEEEEKEKTTEEKIGKGKKV